MAIARSDLIAMEDLRLTAMTRSAPGTQTCAQCHHVAKENRKGTRFHCVACGHEDDADVNAARVIRNKAESPPTRAPGIARGTQQDAA